MIGKILRTDQKVKKRIKTSAQTLAQVGPTTTETKTTLQDGSQLLRTVSTSHVIIFNYHEAPSVKTANQTEYHH